METGVPEMPVHTVAEKRKCASKLADNYYQAGDPSGRLQEDQRLYWDMWAVEWSLYCSNGVWSSAIRASLP